MTVPTTRIFFSICIVLRGITSPHKQKQVLQLVGNHHFAFLTEVKNQCHLPGAWHEFHSDCHGAGGATILLNTTTFPHATLLHTSEHAVAVQANDTVFISLYIPCHARWADAAYVLDWIPVPPLKCIIGGDWNSFATDPRWLEALGSRGLLLCPCPSPFTRMSNTGQTSLLDRVAQTGKLPLAELARGSGVERKTLERHRKYLVAMLLAFTNGFEIIRGHLCRLDAGRGTK